jgi:hypothetical protein
MSDKWKDWSREDLVREYLETRLATIINHIGIKWSHMPTDVPQDPAYWKVKDQDLHNMHFEIARRYNISRDDCLWLENIADNTNLYVSRYRFKPLIESAIRELEKLEEKRKYKN